MADVQEHLNINLMKNTQLHRRQLTRSRIQKVIENESPVNGKVFSHIADSDKELAVKAFLEWIE